MLNNICLKLLSVGKLDLRSLALLRISLASIFIANFFIWFEAIDSSLLVRNILLLIAIAPASLLLIGYRTKLVTIICWLVLFLLHDRNPELVTDSGNILRIIIFWGIFLPLGAYYSCDRALDTSNQPLPRNIVSGGTIGFVFQIGFICLFYLRNLDTLAILFPILLALIPSYIWNILEKKTYSKEIAKLIINYDRDCGFCKKVVCFLRTFLILPGTTIREAQANPSIYANMEKYNSWVIEDYRGKRYFKWYGIIYLVSISPILWWLAPILTIKPLIKLGNKIYETIANNRRLMGKFTKYFLYRQQNIKQTLFLNILSILILLSVIWGNYNLFEVSNNQNILTSTTVQIIKIFKLDLPRNSLN